MIDFAYGAIFQNDRGGGVENRFRFLCPLLYRADLAPAGWKNERHVNICALQWGKPGLALSVDNVYLHRTARTPPALMPLRGEQRLTPTITIIGQSS